MLNINFLLIFLISGGLTANALDLTAAESGGSAGGLEVVTGKVSVAGDFQRPKPLPVFKNRVFCGATVVNETLLIGADRGLRNAVVWLRPVGGKADTRPVSVMLDNKQCAFAPHVQVAPVGSELLLKNSDPILHTVHARIGNETLFNVGLPKWRQVTKRLDRLGVMRIDCDVLHTWMSAAIVVTDTPFFALTDGAGRFKIDGLPAGTYAMEVWHERLGSQQRLISIAPRGISEIEVIYSAEKLR